jgi:hypothetical protein
MQAADHIAYLDHVRDSVLHSAGYSLASWGRDHGGSADSGKALRLRQSRTLYTRAGKEHMARGAISEALSVAVEMDTGMLVEVDVQLGDGMPVDPLETAREIATLESAGMISKREGVRRLHPDWTEEQVEEEAAAVAESGRMSTLTELMNGAES